MAERLGRSDKYKDVLEIGKEAMRIMPRLEEEGIVKVLPLGLHPNVFFPKKQYEANHFCIVCGKQGEFRLREHLQRTHKDVLEPGSIEYKVVEQVSSGITQHMGAARIDLSSITKPVTEGELRIFHEFEQRIRDCGIPTTSHTDPCEYVRRGDLPAIMIMVHEAVNKYLRENDARAQNVMETEHVTH